MIDDDGYCMECGRYLGGGDCPDCDYPEDPFVVDEIQALPAFTIVTNPDAHPSDWVRVRFEGHDEAR